MSEEKKVLQGPGSEQITMGDIVRSVQGFNELMVTRMSAPLGMRIVRLVKRFESELKVFDQARSTVLEKYKIPKGPQVTDPEALKEIEELLELELPEFAGLKRIKLPKEMQLSAGALMVLMPFVDVPDDEATKE